MYAGRLFGVIPEDFTTLYQKAAPLTRRPMNPSQNYEPVDWWRATLAYAYMTGWRIDAILSLRKEGLDMEARTAISRHYDNKGTPTSRPTSRSLSVRQMRPNAVPL